MRKVATVVAFHRVNEVNAGDALTVSPGEFEAYCDFFIRHFEVIPLGDLVARLESGQDVGGTLAITFDDGYLDNREVAAPILRALGLPATFFITTGFVGTEKVAFWDEHLPEPPGWMSWTQVGELREQGFEIGAHSVTHPDFSGLSREEALVELGESKAALEDLLGEPVDLFAYPFGGPEHFTDDNRGFVREAGFRCSPSCFGGLNGPDSDPFRLMRVPINAWYSSPRHFGFQVGLRERI